jgi:hypothetical protein
MFNYRLFVNPLPIGHKVLQSEVIFPVLFATKARFLGQSFTFRKQSFTFRNQTLKPDLYIPFCFHWLEEND